MTVPRYTAGAGEERPIPGQVLVLEKHYNALVAAIGQAQGLIADGRIARAANTLQEAVAYIQAPHGE